MTRSFLRFTVLTLAIVYGFSSLHAQSPLASLQPIAQRNRISANADLGPQAKLTGHIPGWVANGTPAAQSVDLSTNMRLTLVLQRDPTVQAAFVQFLQEQQTPGNPHYHQWLTPQQVGTLFGPTSDDLAAVSNWLTAQGLTIINVEPSLVMINVQGTTSVIANAFHTSFAYYPLNGRVRISAANEPSVPSAIAPVISCIFGLTELPLNPLSYRSGPHQPVNAGSASSAQPELTLSSGAHYMTPGDFAIVYDLNSVYSSGNKGAGSVTSSYGNTKANSVAIIGRSRVALSDIGEFTANTGVNSLFTLNTIIPPLGVDPGPVCTVGTACSTSGDQGEQTLDVDRVLGTAPEVTADLIVSSNAGGGILTAAQYNVSTQLDPVMTISYGACESAAGSANVNAWDAIYSTGAVEGITTFVAAGDSGANGCAAAFTQTSSSTNTASVNYLCASTYATCVGGTEFIEGAGTYWSATNTSSLISVLSYIPEGVWNEPTGCNAGSNFCPSSTGGGPSIYISKPAWQAGTNVPADGKRDTPDIAYPAAAHDAYYACLDFAQANASENCTTNGGGWFVGFSGTSAAAPAMAGVTALLNAKIGTSQGNLNPKLYALAATTSNGVFHDITVGTSGVGTCVLSTPSTCNNSTPGAASNSTNATGGVVGYQVGPGYDMATGLGSIDVANLLSAFSSVLIPTTLSVTATTNPVLTGSSDTFTATLTPSSTTGRAPLGTVVFFSDGNGFGAPVAINNNVAVSARQPYTVTGSHTITAVYSGDSNYASSTSPGLALSVNVGPNFYLSPASLNMSFISGATTGNTNNITVTSQNGFAGTVALACAVTTASGNVVGTCTISSPVTLAAGGSGSSTLTINTTAGTSGQLSVSLTGTSGTNVVTTLSPIAVGVAVSSFTMAVSPFNISIGGNATTGNTASVTITSVNGFTGTVTVGCVSSNTAIASCTGGSAVVAPSAPSVVTVTVTPVIHSSGVTTFLISGSGTTAGATIAATASTSAEVIVTTVPSATSLAISPSPVLSGSPTTFTATVTGTNGTATGLVFFYSGTTELNVNGATLSTTAGATTATYTYMATAPSATPLAITARYSGDSGYVASSSAATNLMVAGSTASAGAATLSFTSGATTGNTDTITFTSVGGFAGTIAVTCIITPNSGTPAFPATCAASPASVSIATGGTATSAIVISSTTAQGKISESERAGVIGRRLCEVAYVAMLVCLVSFRRRFIRSLTVFLLLSCVVVVISGCSGSGTGSTPANRSSAGIYTVTAAGSSSTAQSTATFTVTIN